MKLDVQFQSRPLSASEYMLALHEPEDHVAVLLVNRHRGQTPQRIANVETLVAPEFQNWLRDQNRSDSDVYVTWNRTGRFALPFAASWFGLTGPHRTL